MKIETFKLFLEKRYKQSSAETILNYMWRGGIPVVPKFFEETFGKTEMYCFQAIEPHRIPSVLKRQHKKNSVSTFTHWDDPERIFWGAEGLGWHDDYIGGLTIVAVLKGKVAFKGGTDLWTATNSHSGRRWIIPGSIRGEIGRVLNNLSHRIKKEFRFEVPNLDLKYFKPLFDKGYKVYWDYNYTSYDAYEGLWEIGDEYTKSLNSGKKIKKSDFNKEKNKVIKLYHDIAYSMIKKYKKEIEQAMRIDLQDVSTQYNEVLCYDYQVQEFIVYFEGSYNEFIDEYPDVADELSKTGVHWNVFRYLKSINKKLKFYQKKNKEMK